MAFQLASLAMVGVVSASMAFVSMVYAVIASMACYVFASMAYVSRPDVVSLPTAVVSA